MTKSALVLLSFMLLFFSCNSHSQVFSPSDIPNLLVWYDAQDQSLSPDSIAVWPDKSGNGHDLLQGIEDRQPVLVTNELNGKSAVQFTAAQNTFMESDFGGSFSSNNSIFIIYKTTSSADQFIFDGLNETNSLALRNGKNYFYILNANFSLNFTKTYPFDYQLNTIIINGDSSQIFENQTLMDQDFLPSSTFTGLTLGRHRNSNYKFSGNIAEIIFFNRVLDTNEIEQVEQYLGVKYGGQANLGSNISQYGFCDTTLYAGKRFTSYLWSDGSTTDSIIISQSGTYWVEVEDIFGFISRDTIEVDIPELQYPTTQLYCQNDSIIWQTGLGQHYNYLWSDGSTADTLVINSPGDIHVAITDTNGCVFQSDTLSFAADLFSTTATLGADHDLCSGNNLSLLSGASEAVSYLWNTGSTATSIPIENSGIYSVEVTNNNGCVAKDTVEITIIGEAPVLEIDFPQNACLSAPFDFKDVSTTTDGSTLSSWTWEFGDGNISALEEGTHYYSGLGNYEVNYTVGTTAGCYRDTTFTIAVKDNPVLSFSSSEVCQGDEVNFHGGQLSPVLISTWDWEFGDSGANNTASGQSTSHIYDSHGNYVVQLVGTDIYGCKDTVIAAKVIAPLPDVAFAFNEICEGKVVNFQNQTTVASPSTLASYTWNFGDGTTSGQVQPQKPYVSHGEYTVTLTGTTEDGCSASAADTLKVHAIPVVDYNLHQACAGLATALEDQSFVANGSVAQVEWSINGAPSLLGFTVEKIFDYPGNYHLKQTVKSAFGCNNAKETQIQIQEALAADFAFSPNAFVVDENIAFTNQSLGATEYEWQFGDFATSFVADTSLVFTEDQIGEEITVQLLVRNAEGCVDSTSLVRTVLGRHTDLAITELFTQETNGFLTIGVRLKNEGETPIEKVELSLRKSGFPLLKEIWTGELYAQQEEVYVFSTTLSANIAQDDSLNQYICVSGSLLDNPFSESDLSNNEVCKVLGSEQVVLLQPYPNPVSDKLNLRLVLPFSEEGSLLIYDQQGRLVKTVFENQVLEEGLSVFEVDVSEVAGGKYLVVYRGSEVRVVGVVVNG